jgi:hypothetical protein
VLHLSRSAAEIEAMRAVKAALDPAGLLNPGVLFTLGGNDPPQTPLAPGGKPFPPDPIGPPSRGTSRSSIRPG